MNHRTLLLLTALTLPVSAVTRTVTTDVDEFNTPSGVDLSLREAIRDSSSTDVIDFNTSLSGKTIELTMGQIDITSTTLTIDASSLFLGITISGGGNSRILQIESSTVEINGVTFTQGSVAGDGGALYLFSSSDVTLTECLFFDNEAEDGGAIEHGRFLNQVENHSRQAC